MKKPTATFSCCASLRHEDKPKVTDRAIDHCGNSGAIHTHKLWLSTGFFSLQILSSKYLSKKFQLFMYHCVCNVFYCVCDVFLSYDACMHSRSWSKCVCRPSCPGTEHTIRAFWKVLHLLTKLLWPPMSFYTKNKHN